VPEQERQISYIRDAAQQLADIVNDLLDLAKVESGKTEVHLAPVHINQFLGATRALMRPLVTDEAVALVFEEAAPHLVIETDESKLGQILRNLVSNALKFTEVGEVRVSAEVSHSGDAIVFTVKDTGIGIHPKDQERVFQEFSQVANPIQKQVKGTGLGLSLSRRLAVLLGGALTMESAVGKGSTFRLSLPYRPPPGMIVAAANVGSGAKSRKGILIVDDEEPSRYLAHQLFRGSRYYLIDSDGLDAAERARFENPALIVLDLSMPGRSGFDVLDELKADERTAHIPVVIHTSKILSDADYGRLAGRQIAVLPKGPSGRLPALLAMRAVLGEPDLFAAEPEFS
jgi:CheY-like chemotaxis protein/two-component sensor histidine kinase